MVAALDIYLTDFEIEQLVAMVLRIQWRARTCIGLNDEVSGKFSKSWNHGLFFLSASYLSLIEFERLRATLTVFIVIFIYIYTIYLYL